MTDEQIALRIQVLFQMLSRSGASRVALSDITTFVGMDDQESSRIAGLLAMLGHFPAADGEHYPMSEPECDGATTRQRERATELKIEVALQKLAGRGHLEPAPEEIHAEAERLFAGHIPPQQFIEALDRIARRPPVPLRAPGRDQVACEDRGEGRLLDSGQEAVMDAFRAFLEDVTPEDFSAAA